MNRSLDHPGRSWSLVSPIGDDAEELHREVGYGDRAVIVAAVKKQAVALGHDVGLIAVAVEHRAGEDEEKLVTGVAKNIFRGVGDLLVDRHERRLKRFLKRKSVGQSAVAVTFLGAASDDLFLIGSANEDGVDVATVVLEELPDRDAQGTGDAGEGGNGTADLAVLDLGELAFREVHLDGELRERDIAFGSVSTNSFSDLLFDGFQSSGLVIKVGVADSRKFAPRKLELIEVRVFVTAWLGVDLTECGANARDPA